MVMSFVNRPLGIPGLIVTSNSLHLRDCLILRPVVCCDDSGDILQQHVINIASCLARYVVVHLIIITHELYVFIIPGPCPGLSPDARYVVRIAEKTSSKSDLPLDLLLYRMMMLLSSRAGTRWRWCHVLAGLRYD